jgi:hypothetical protein
VRDNQALLRNILAQPELPQEPRCALLGATVVVAGVPRVWGDWDCNGAIGVRDSQAVLRHILSQPPLSQQAGCPALGSN